MIKQCSRGLTLIDLIVTLSLLSIIATFATAGWSVMVEKISASRMQSDISHIFAEARMTAVNERLLTTICPLDSAGNCSNDWNTSVSIFIDPTASQRLTDPSYMRKIYDVSTNGDLRASLSGPQERRYFQYNPDGSVHGTIGNLTWCPNSRNNQRALQARINFGGRLNWAVDNDNDGIAEDSSGSPLNCR